MSAATEYFKAAVESAQQTAAELSAAEQETLERQAEALPLRRDMATLLLYVRDNTVIGTQSTGNLPLKAVREIRKLIASPDFMLGSVNAVTESGILVAASATASQLGPYANTAGKVILVVGSQKIVSDLDAALRRIREYILPWEDAQVRKVMPTGSFVGKILIVEREWMAGRMTVILVRQPIGV